MNKKIFCAVLVAWLPLAFLATLLFSSMYLAVQQDIRIGANDPQIQMAEDAARAAENGANIFSMIPSEKIDIAKSLAPFVMAFDDRAQVSASSAVLDGVTPNIPSGAFDVARLNGENRLTWQPEPTVRQAIVIVYYGGEHPGFIVAGRSLREVEKREGMLSLQVGLAWIVAMFGSLVLASILVIFKKKP